MLKAIHGLDDRRRGSRGLVLSIAEKEDGTLRLSVDQVISGNSALPNSWNFRVFQNHFEIDQTYLEIVENELQRPDSEKGDEGIGVPDSVLAGIGHALIVQLIAAALDARKAGPV